MKSIFIAALLTVSYAAPAQTTETIYRTRGDSTANYYLAMTPRAASKGLLIILPGFGTTPQEVLQETNLPAVARSNGFTVIIPLLLSYEQIDSTNLYQKLLTNLVPELIRKYNVPKNRFMIGGHSIGGHQAISYAEQAYKLNNGDIIKPQLVFGVDPPLDMKRLWNSFTYNKRINFSEASIKEAEFMMKRFILQFGGSPDQRAAIYENYSSFYRDAENGGNIQYLKTIPVRLYCDPDISWFIENRRTSFEYINASDLSASISQLKLLGNDDAELVVCLGKGYLPDGRRHPHAFSMLDANEFIAWANKILQQ